ncbi:MAG: tetratricopeptide repeat protein [Deltaproteobacteria bacterium]|nr:tetratricopeptide repeat protein [Deltaproteobacteria bacterium]
MRDKRFFFVALALSMSLLTSCGRVTLMEAGKDPLSADEHLRLGALYEAKNEVVPALREYKGAIAADPGNPAAWFGLGNVYLKKKMYNEAIGSYLKAVELDPKNGVFHNNLGWAYMETGRFDKAEEAVRDAIRIDPSGLHMYLDTLGVIEMRRGDYAGAQRSFKEAATAAPVTDTAGLKIIYGHLLELYAATGDSSGASWAEEKIKAVDAAAPRR